MLSVAELSVTVPTPRGDLSAVNSVSFDLHEPERVAIVGESGSGKSMTAAALLGMAPASALVTGSVRYEQTEIVGCSERRLAKIRGSGMALIPQHAGTALNPLRTIGSQLIEALRLCQHMTRSQARQRATELLQLVNLTDPERILGQLGHQLSGGMAQRVVVAAALATEPRLLIADEPTSSLDALTGADVLDLLTSLNETRSLTILIITHDMNAVAQFAERVIVMYAGRMVEDGPASEVLARPGHPYTKGLLESVPGRTRRVLTGIPGTVPDLARLPAGCAFRPRCTVSQGRAECSSEAPVVRSVPGRTPAHQSDCHFAKEVLAPDPTDLVALPSRADVAGPELLAVENLSKTFTVRAGLGRRRGSVTAVEPISFSIRAGEVLALVGQSGSGKSTTGRMILGLETPTSGVVKIGDEILPRLEKRGPQTLRQLQVVFQDPGSSLDPLMCVRDVVAEPLRQQARMDSERRAARVREVLKLVGLADEYLDRYPFQLSGGQRQRVAIARALSGAPDIIVCDEPLTALDVSVQAQVITVLREVQATRGVSYLFIAHDLTAVRQLADRVAVMRAGRIVELASVEQFFAQPSHDYSTALLRSVPEWEG